MINQIKTQSVSEQLICQHFSKYLVSRIIQEILPEKMLKEYRYQDLKYELWHNCLWTNYGFVSYFRYAEMLKWITVCKAEQLPVKPLGDRLFLVKGVQKKWYAVTKTDTTIKCECMLYKQREKRHEELPQLFQWFNHPFCHHTQAVKNY